MLSLPVAGKVPVITVWTQMALRSSGPAATCGEMRLQSLRLGTLAWDGGFCGTSLSIHNVSPVLSPQKESSLGLPPFITIMTGQPINDGQTQQLQDRWLRVLTCEV